MSKKPTITEVTSGYLSGSTINTNFESLRDAFDNTLSLDGSTPNAMNADLDLNSNNIVNGGYLYGDRLYLGGVRVTSVSATPEWKSEWATSTAYKVDNLVREAGSVYICLEDHTSGTFSTDLSADKWELFASQGSAGAGTGDMLAANNLSDVSSAATSRSNLGLGTMATQGASSVTITGGTAALTSLSASGAVVGGNLSMYATYGGTANVITLTTGLSLSALTTGQEFRFRATAANTGGTTINVDGIGPLTAKTPTGAALPAGFIRTDVDTVCRYDGTDIIVSRAVEKGSNANGAYERYENGTMVCHSRIVTLTGSGANLAATHTFAAAFSSTTDLAVMLTQRTGLDATNSTLWATNATPSQSDIGHPAYGVLTTTSVSLRQYRTGFTDFVSGDELYLSVMATGDWY